MDHCNAKPTHVKKVPYRYSLACFDTTATGLRGILKTTVLVSPVFSGTSIL